MHMGSCSLSWGTQFQLKVVDTLAYTQRANNSCLAFVGPSLPTSVSTLEPISMMDYKDPKKHMLWHHTELCRLRFVSFVAEQFWNMAFKQRKGLNSLTADSVQSVLLSKVSINGRKYKDKEFKVDEDDAAIALRIANGEVIA